MKPIINPWWIYFAEKSEGVGLALLLVGLVSVMCSIIWAVSYRIGESRSTCPKWLVILGTIATIFGAVLPTRNTILEMVTVSQITPDNIKAVGNTGKDVIDYIVDKIDEIVNEGEDKNEK